MTPTDSTPGDRVNQAQCGSSRQDVYVSISDSYRGEAFSVSGPQFIALKLHAEWLVRVRNPLLGAV